MAKPGKRKGKTYLTDVAQPILTYIHPRANEALNLMALRQSKPGGYVKKHDLAILAFEEFFDKRGIKVPVRVDMKKERARA